MRILQSLAQAGGPVSLSGLAADTGLAAAKLHRYLASFVETGMVTHRPSGTYDLGRGAAEIGMAALARQDPANRTADALPELVDETGLTATLAIWGTQGPTVVRWERAATPLVTMLGLGSVIPPLQSATGRAFLAYYPDRISLPVVLDAGGTKEMLEEMRQKIREDGLATADSDFIPGLVALAAPVLDIAHQPCAVVTLISADARMIRPDSDARRALKAFVAEKR